MRKYLIALALMLMPIFAYAEPILSWTPPTQNVDGTTIPATGPTSLDGYKIYAFPSGSPANGLMVDISDPNMLTYNFNGLTPGLWSFSLSAYNVAGAESARTGEVTATVASLTMPLPPPGMTFSTYEVGVYNLVKKNNGFTLVYVGQVPLNTPCDPLQSVNGFNAVPLSSVTSWSGSVRPIVVLAKCSIH